MQRIRVRPASVANATATIERLSSQLVSNLASSPLERTTSIIAIAALSNLTTSATTPGGRTDNATEVLLGRLISQLFSLPDVYATDLLTLPAAATAAAALASITGHTSLKLDVRYTALEALNRYGFCPIIVIWKQSSNSALASVYEVLKTDG
jgi:hypothetical protein